MSIVLPAPRADRHEQKLLAILNQLSLFKDLDAPARAVIGYDIRWFGLPAGATLYEEGEPSDALHILVSGMLLVTQAGERGRRVTSGYIHAGETVGALSLIAGELRPATVSALRDSTVLSLDRYAFDRMLEEHPLIAGRLMRIAAARQARIAQTYKKVNHAKTVALIAIDPGVAAGTFAMALADRLDRIDRPAPDRLPTRVLGAEAAGFSELEFHDLEERHARLLYCARLFDDSGRIHPGWARRCYRQADHILILASPHTEPPRPVLAELSARRHEPRPHDLVLLQPASRSVPIEPAASLINLPADLRVNVRASNIGDLDRLARLLTGKAAGLVLSGGGARGYSHLGVIKALASTGMPIDLLGGSSIGSIMAAGLAVGWGYDDLCTNIKEAFAVTNPLNDYTFPFVSLTRGGKVSRRLRRYFGDLTFDHAWRPFYCISSNLTKGDVEVHRKGLLWRALRASIAIPGIMPPLIERGNVLVDGGVMNNLPTDIMQNYRRGPVIAVDVGQVRAFSCTIDDYQDYAWWRTLLGDRGGAPGMITLLTRSATVSSEVHARVCRAHADLLFTPPVEDVELRAWKTLEHCVDVGYRHAMEAIAKIETPWWS